MVMGVSIRGTGFITGFSTNAFFIVGVRTFAIISFLTIIAS